MKYKTYAYGFPRLGSNREYKKYIESFWQNKLSEDELTEKIEELQISIYEIYNKYVDEYPLNEITFYDKFLDTAIILGLYSPENLNDYYNLCRGKNALPMRKWFNTNYHYIVPDFLNKEIKPNIKSFQQLYPFYNINELNLIGPYTFLKLSHGVINYEKTAMLLANTYKEIFNIYKPSYIHLEEPAFVYEINKEEEELIRLLYNEFELQDNINIFTYYDSVDDLRILYNLPVKGIGLDFIHGNNIENIKKYGFPEDKILYAGIINGKNIWKCDYNKIENILHCINIYAKNIILSNASPLYHLPYSVNNENTNIYNIYSKLSFALEKLEELSNLSLSNNTFLELESFPVETIKFNEIPEEEFTKSIEAEKRRELHKKIFNFPNFPVTTIGSFPQTSELREMRSKLKNSDISELQYKEYIKDEIKKVIKLQEELGLDVLVHGEFERTDMVEYFATKLNGMLKTENGWIISYGTRVYRPPIIYDDIIRTQPMTIDEISYAQSLTIKPVKGMLTGPITILSWSFPRIDIPEEVVAYQIALALREEIYDYEREGIKIVQVDEPAIREHAPIKKSQWKKYFEYAVKSFNLATNTSPKTQIHTHMCYSEFKDIIEYINKMDFDVITVEGYRNKGEIAKEFAKIDFKREIGIGIWDIHSPVVPSIEDMTAIIKNIMQFIPKKNIWINPDCGLKTRGWDETLRSIKNMVNVAETLRK